MRTNRLYWLLCGSLLLCLSIPAHVHGFDLGGAVNRAKKEKEKLEREKEKAKREATGESQKPAPQETQGGASTGAQEGTTAGTPAAPAAAVGGQVVFSKAPVDATNPAGLINAFAAGDEIYALAKFPKPID